MSEEKQAAEFSAEDQELIARMISPARAARVCGVERRGETVAFDMGSFRLILPINEEQMMAAVRGAVLALQNPPSPTPTGPRVCHVYFLRRETDGAIKIGSSVNPEERKKALGRRGKVLLGTICFDEESPARSHEAALHRQFAAHRLGGEWFDPCEELLNYILEASTQWPGDA